ncbi:MAG: helix-turn-helix domain-containing protein [Candidatus Stygibacter frigidus]|nr:helix-turn-helix domain-containing protein [Candidatus Stygibacter frigidus]
MKKEKIFELLQKNGLAERESKVYYALLSNPNSTPTKLQNITGINRTKIYEVLSSLLSKDLIAEELIGKKKAYRILEPESALKSVVIDKEEELQTLKENNEKLVKMATEIYEKTDLERPPFYQLEHLSDPVAIRSRYEYHLSRTRRELLIFSKPPYAASSGEFDEVIDKRVQVRTIMENSAELTSELLEEIVDDPREEIRFLDELPLKLVIMDEKVSILAMGVNNSKEGKINTIFLDEALIAQFMKELFESKWKKAIPIGTIKKNMKSKLVI